ncbi:AraC family transcriptional regulator [Kiritimatiellota bacterium B12222]|nr:AraC family transcriptional regulator [Kiritimatiellota bacterium B12222]
MKLPKQRISDWGKLDIQLYYGYEGQVPYYGHGEVVNHTYSTWLVLQGWGEVTDAGSMESVIARKGQWMFVRPGQRMQKFSERARLLSIGFFAKYITGQPLVEFDDSFCVDAEQFPELELIAKRIPLILQEASQTGGTQNAVVDMFDFLRIQKLLLEWVEEWCRVLGQMGHEMHSPLGQDQRVVKAIKLLEKNMESKHFSAEQVARETGVSVSQLNRLFLNETGLTLNDFRNRERTNHAIRLLMQSEMSLKEIAFDLGFSYPSHFSAWFRRQRGVSPSVYRKMYEHVMTDG